MVRQLKERNILTIPKKILEHVGLKPGDYVEVSDDGYKIIITPKVIEEGFTDKEWEKLKSLAKEKGGKTFRGGKALLKHLERISKE